MYDVCLDRIKLVMGMMNEDGLALATSPLLLLLCFHVSMTKHLFAATPFVSENGGSRERMFQLRCVSASGSLQFDFSPPPIDHDLLDTISVAGGKVSEDGVVESFDNDDEALDAFDNGVVISFLKGCDTVFVNPTARTIDIAHAWIMKNAIILTVSPTTCQSIIEMLNKDQGHHQANLLICFSRTEKLDKLCQLNLGDLIGQPYGKHQHYSFDGMPITVGVGSLITDEGFTMLMSPGSAVSVWKTLLSEGAIPMGSVPWEELKIIQGRPAPERELSNSMLWRRVYGTRSL